MAIDTIPLSLCYSWDNKVVGSVIHPAGLLIMSDATVLILAALVVARVHAGKGTATRVLSVLDYSIAGLTVDEMELVVHVE